MPHGFLNQRRRRPLEPVDQALDLLAERSGRGVTPNPLVPGFNPDPSIVRVDGVYYLVTSTFEYLPGLPVYRSTDLVEWTHIGNVATRPEQVELEKVPTPGGVWAPTIRYRDGVFYVIVTVMLGGRGCVVFTATDPAGPWSDGTPIPAVDGIDPDLAWDDDGTAYVTFAGFPHAIRQVRVDLATGEALEELRPLWAGTGRFAPEGPHLYRRGEHWYLLVAEGGTDRGHAVSIARGPVAHRPVGEQPGQPGADRHRHGEPGAEPRARRPRRDAGRRHRDGAARRAAGRVRPGLLRRSAARRSWPRCAGWTAGRRPTWSRRPATPDEDVAFDLDPHSGRPRLAGRPPHPGRGRGGEGRPAGDHRRRARPRRSSARGSSAGGSGTCPRRSRRASTPPRVAAGWPPGTTRCTSSPSRRSGDGATTTVTARAALAGFERTWQRRVPGRRGGAADGAAPTAERIRAGAPRAAAPVRLVAGGGGREVVLAEFDGRYWSFEVAKSFTGRVFGLYAADGTVTFAELRYRGTDAVPDVPTVGCRRLPGQDEGDGDRRR